MNHKTAPQHVKALTTSTSGVVMARITTSGNLHITPLHADANLKPAKASSAAMFAVDEYALPPALIENMTPGYQGVWPGLTTVVSHYGAVKRLRTLDLWETLLAAIITTEHTIDVAGEIWHSLCIEHGHTINHPPTSNLNETRSDYNDQAYRYDNDIDCFSIRPEPGIIAGLSRADHVGAGLSTIATDHITRTAAAFLNTTTWPTTPEELIDALKTSGIPGTPVRIAVAHHTGDYTHYPATPTLKAAVETLTPRTTWPSNNTDWTRAWHDHTHPYTSTATALTLAHAAPHRDRITA